MKLTKRPSCSSAVAAISQRRVRASAVCNLLHCECSSSWIDILCLHCGAGTLLVDLPDIVSPDVRELSHAVKQGTNAAKELSELIGASGFEFATGESLTGPDLPQIKEVAATLSATQFALMNC